MDEIEVKLSDEEVALARERRLVAQHLQAMEGNPLDQTDIEMFEMFERERWSHEKRRAYIVEQARAATGRRAAE